MSKVKWKRNPDQHDYPAADDYLSLLVEDPLLRAELVARFEDAPIAHYKAKDLLRASQLPLLPKTNPHVAVDLKKIAKKLVLSPVLLVRGDLVRGFPLQVADGYHRVCASYLVDENMDIPCRIVDLPKAVRPPVKNAPSTTVVVATPVAEAPVKKAPATKAPAKKVPATKAPARKTVPPLAAPFVAPVIAPATDES